MFSRTTGVMRSRWLIPVVSAGLLLLTPALALAHLHLVRSAPAAGAVLDTVPRDIRLTFTEAAQLAVSFVDLTDAAGATVATGPLALDPASPRTLVVPIAGSLASGRYTIAWRTTSDDGHPVHGTIAFAIAAGAAGIARQPSPSVVPDAARAGGAAAPAPAPVVSPAASQSEFDAGSPLYAALRALGFMGTLGMIGAAVFGLCVVPRFSRHTEHGDALAANAGQRVARLGRVAAWVVLAVAVGRLMAQSYAVHGGSRAWDGALLGSMVTATVWGRAWMLCVVAALLGIVAFSVARQGARAGWGLAGLASLALASSLALSGHAVATPQATGLAVAADVVHVLAAGGWLGTLLAMVVAGMPAALAEPRETRGPLVAMLVNLFSPVALTCVAALVLTGVIAAWLHLGSLPALWSSSYGQVLILKLVLVLVVVAFGAVNWRVMRPQLGDERAALRIRRSATGELVMGVLVLIVTAILVALPPPAEQVTPPVARAAPAATARS